MVALCPWPLIVLAGRSVVQLVVQLIVSKVDAKIVGFDLLQIMTVNFCQL